MVFCRDHNSESSGTEDTKVVRTVQGLRYRLYTEDTAAVQAVHHIIEDITVVRAVRGLKYKLYKDGSTGCRGYSLWK